MRYSLILPLACILFFVLVSASGRISAPDAALLKGAWKLTTDNGQPAENEQVRIFSNGYSMFATYQLAAKNFIRAGGGPYELKGGQLTFTIDYDSKDSTLVGRKAVFSAKIKGNTLELSSKTPSGKMTQMWTRLDDGNAPLAGDWRIRSRMGEDGAMYEIKPSPRKTIKILSGTRFHWAAMNTETRQFSGTGGGTYTFENGKYTETIEFFSRDNSRVGATLSFDGSVSGDDWTHSGKSSRGQDIKEIWRRE